LVELGFLYERKDLIDKVLGLILFVIKDAGLPYRETGVSFLLHGRAQVAFPDHLVKRRMLKEIGSPMTTMCTASPWRTS